MKDYELASELRAFHHYEAAKRLEVLSAKRVVYVVTRGKSILAQRPEAVLFLGSFEKANALIDSHANFRVQEEGARFQREQKFQPPEVPVGHKVRVGGSENHPVLADADPIIACVIREVELLEKNGERTLYRLVQHCFQE